MKKLKVWFEYWSPDMPVDEDNFLIKALKQKYDVELAYPADIVFFSNYSPPPYTGILGRLYRMYIILFKKNRFGVPSIDWLKGDHKKVFVCEENVRPDLSKADLSLCFDREEIVKGGDRYMRFPFYAMVHQDSLAQLVGEARIKLVSEKRATKFCEFVYSKSVAHREGFFDALNAYKKIDSPGKSRNNMPPIGSFSSSQDSREELNWMEQKIAFSLQYKFSIAIENTSYPGYVTEKIVNAYAAGCIPIYYGDPTIVEDFNPESFVNLHDYESFEDAVEVIKKIDQDDESYRKMLNASVFKGGQVPYTISSQCLLEKVGDILFNG